MFIFQFAQRTKDIQTTQNIFQEQKQAAEQSVVNTAKNLENLKIPLPTIPKISEATTSQQVNTMMASFYKDIQQQIQTQIEQKPEQYANVMNLMNTDIARLSLIEKITVETTNLIKESKARQDLIEDLDKSKAAELMNAKTPEEIAEITKKYDERYAAVYNAKSFDELNNLAKQWGYNDLEKQVNDFVSGLIQRIKQTIYMNSIAFMGLKPQMNAIIFDIQKRERAKEIVAGSVANAVSTYLKSDSAKFLSAEEKAADFLAKTDKAKFIANMKLQLRLDAGVPLSETTQIAESAFLAAQEIASGKIKTSTGERVLPAMTEQEMKSAILEVLGAQQQQNAPRQQTPTTGLGSLRFQVVPQNQGPEQTPLPQGQAQQPQTQAA